MVNLNINNINQLLNANTDGTFKTNVNSTKGYLTLNNSGKVVNVGRHWYNVFSKPGDSEKNYEIKEAIINAFESEQVDEKFINRIRVSLGMNEDTTKNTPISRRVLKQIVSEYNTLKKEETDTEVAHYQAVFKQDIETAKNKLFESMQIEQTSGKAGLISLAFQEINNYGNMVIRDIANKTKNPVEYAQKFKNRIDSTLKQNFVLGIEKKEYYILDKLITEFEYIIDNYVKDED